ncbi:MAG: NAD(P)-binding domain-containing protein [Candidatus Eisenbacteria bacterium]|uniref:NAD(P)-binding domain-containing protein n=1 Tax=Eiseniibacteriota bacterium TaxID=2212470 RepID=A0A849SZA9_UNCEI|nr:NAD(P)-binding domain-containing protein [Candidatus Eisenbacteria bacterium]
MTENLRRFARWLHLRWPAGTVEPLPEVGLDGSTAVPGLYVAGDLTGVPLLKFALDSGARVARTIANDPLMRARSNDASVPDLLVIGAGVSGLAAAAEAQALGLSYRVIEAAEPLATLIDFPRAKPIFTYPHGWQPAGAVQVGAKIKEALVDELRSQTEALGIVTTPGRVTRVSRDGDRMTAHMADGETVHARRVLVAIGRSGEFRPLESAPVSSGKVFHRLHDPNDHRGLDVLVVGGGDSALESAIALAECGARVTLSYRKQSFARPKRENLARLESLAREGRLQLALGSTVSEVRADEVVLKNRDGESTTIPNHVVFAMLGRAAPLEFFRRSGVPIAGEMTPRRWAAMGAFVLFCAWLYNWKSGGWFSELWYQRHWFPTNLPELLARAGGAITTAAADPGTLLGTLAISASGPSFWYTLAYSTVVTVFGIQRIQRRRTPYITAQTLTLIAVQVVPLFLLPEVILPLMDRHGWLPRTLADALFPVVTYGHGREFWRAYGLILAWPLNVYNIFTHEPLWAWIAIGGLQTLVLIPLGIYFFGKGVYCGWICSCGALAETLGDTHRHKMPHGPGWNRLNLAGQGILAIALALLVLRIVGWILPDGNAIDRVFDPVLKERYKWLVDVFLAGVVGYGVYFWYSGRFWCRFFCPLAALMHIYARFSRFAIVADKKKCISCNVCTSVCHQGIDVMSFANQGAPMQDPQCVRCSACVQSCPTGVLTFGQVRRDGSLISIDSLLASPVQMRERD